jgi:hypothetical protein
MIIRWLVCPNNAFEVAGTVKIFSERERRTGLAWEVVAPQVDNELRWNVHSHRPTGCIRPKIRHNINFPGTYLFPVTPMPVEQYLAAVLKYRIHCRLRLAAADADIVHGPSWDQKIRTFTLSYSPYWPRGTGWRGQRRRRVEISQNANFNPFAF